MCARVCVYVCGGRGEIRYIKFNTDRNGVDGSDDRKGVPVGSRRKNG